MEEIRPFATKEISRAALCACIVTLLLTMSCSYLRRSATSQKAPSPPVEVKDPIISMVMASSIDAKGQLVNPRFTFPQNEPQMTAVVRVGKIKGSQLKVTWYKTSESGDEKLFEHQIQVKSNDRAFSVGKNASGTLLAGTYKVVATLEGQTKDMEFDVSPPKNAQSKTSSGRSEKVFEDQSLMQEVAWDALESNRFCGGGRLGSSFWTKRNRTSIGSNSEWRNGHPQGALDFPIRQSVYRRY
jgi:hypothetical protein